MPAVTTRAREPLDDYGNPRDGGAARHREFQPGGRARGLHDPAAEYSAMDVVAFNGSEWRAVRDNPGPLPGDGWVLGAKGARGKPGEPGKPGVHVKAMDVVGYTLVLTLSDGTTVRATLLPMLELYERERKP